MTPEQAAAAHGVYSKEYAQAIEAAKRADPDNDEAQQAREWLERWDMFAASALTGLLAAVQPRVSADEFAERAGKMADAMMRVQPST